MSRILKFVINKSIVLAVKSSKDFSFKPDYSVRLSEKKFIFFLKKIKEI